MGEWRIVMQGLFAQRERRENCDEAREGCCIDQMALVTYSFTRWQHYLACVWMILISWYTTITSYIHFGLKSLKSNLIGHSLTGLGNNACAWFGEVCLCCCLPHLPQLACNILVTIYKPERGAQYRKNVTRSIFIISRERNFNISWTTGQNDSQVLTGRGSDITD